MNDREKQLKAIDRLLTIMDELRVQCPWDRKQSFESLRHLTIEETYELGDAILDKDLTAIKGELGDLLLHIVFYAKLGSEVGAFDFGSLTEAICDKLVSRHPHIYGDVTVADEEEVKRNWEQLKLKEGKKSVLEGVPKSLPAMVKANRIQEKVAGVGFDWEEPHQVFDKVQEELLEFNTEVAKRDAEKMTEEFGDLLFSMINYARFLNIDPESALERTNKKFMKRFVYLEQKAQNSGQNLKDMTLDQMEAFWQEAKQL
ncbi:MAG: nucleoside triphosphate pyrophosphohydrolase [Flavobacteriaceae bacterium]|jgi:XTP/dITP diphosphohydrolase|nr:nucleoside triphosphate pyrophosphohydrolase [Flavobacteriaceae bacterium]MDG1063622.1 nucleoside triphosphate pyrophosphohydrolase [Flavobacteriaceae bacterium]MDG1962075.1 nucleoside triphosphate pyrophosphohydrolase [Flavobacteriaceae bacterium]